MELCHAVLNSSFPGPELDHWSLPNGAGCVMAEMPDAPLTCLDFWCRAGSLSEQDGEEGMAHFLEHMLFKGSRHLPPGAFDQAIEALGGSSNAATGFDDVHFHVLIPPERTRDALEHLLELVLQPTLDSEGFAMERDVVLEEIAQYADQPSEQVLQQLLTRGCGSHPYGRPILGHRASLEAMTPASMACFHRRSFLGSNCSLAVAGQSINGLREMLSESQLAELPSGVSPSTAGQQMQIQSGRHLLKLDRLESARLLMLWSAASAGDQEAVMGIDLATTLLGEGRRSRLVKRLREELQLVESVTMDLTALEKGSLITLEVICAQEALPAVEVELNDLLARTTEQPVSAPEMKRARQLVSNGLRYALESTGQVAAMSAGHSLWNREQKLLAPLDHLEAWDPERIRSELCPALQPEQAFVLIAQPGETC